MTFGSVTQPGWRRCCWTRPAELAPRCSTLPATHQELASRLGTVREVVSRNLPDAFGPQGLIRIPGPPGRNHPTAPGFSKRAEPQPLESGLFQRKQITRSTSRAHEVGRIVRTEGQ